MLSLNLKLVATLQDRYFKPEGSHVPDHNYILLIYPNLVQEHKMSINSAKLGKSAGKKKPAMV